MIRQSQNYFAAAVSAALLNAAAVAAFVLFTLLSSINGFPLKGIIGSADSISPPAQSSAPSGGTDAPRDAFLRGGGLRGDRGFPDTRVGSASGAGPTASIDLSGSGRSANGTGVAPVSVGSGGSGGSGGGTGGSGGGTPGPGATPGLVGANTTLPTTPSPGVGQVVQGLSGTVSDAPAAVNNGVGNTISGADALLGNSLSSGGVSQTAQGAGNMLLGSGSAAGQATGAVGQLTGSLDGPRLGAGN